MIYMCKRNWESIDHLLLHCDLAHVLWSALFSQFKLVWVMPRRVLDLCACWWSSRRSRTVEIWKILPIRLFWTIWREKNNRQFEDLESLVEDILASLLHSLHIWIAAYLAP
jgi:hypothetical protein